MDRFDNLCKHFFEVAEEAAKNEGSTKVLHGVLSEFKSNLPSLGATTVGMYSQSIVSPLRVQRDEDNITTRDENLVPEIHSPLRVIRKGRPPSKRKMSTGEKAVQKCRKRTNKSHDKLTTKACAYFQIVYNFVVVVTISFIFVQLCRNSTLKGLLIKVETTYM